MSRKSDARIHIAAFSGSARADAYTWKAMQLVIDEFGQHDEVHLDVIDARELSLALPGVAVESSDAKRIQQQMGDATGIVIATPEYHGTFSAATKLFIENLGFPSVLSGKPIALLGVAAGQIGAIKALEHLRSVCSHIGGIVLPGPVSIAGVQRTFDAEGRCLDDKVAQRTRGVATNLLHYIERNICPRIALEQMVREQ